jgi:hypothetical protein
LNYFLGAYSPPDTKRSSSAFVTILNTAPFQP